MKVDVIASGSRTPARRMTHIIVGPAPDWNGVKYAAQALIPPAMIMSDSRTPGCTCRASSHTPAPISLEGYAPLTRPRDHPQRAAAQSQGHHRRAAAVRPHGRYRTVGVGQELAGVRYALRRGPAPLYRVALDVCQTVPRADAETVGGQHRGHVSGGG